MLIQYIKTALGLIQEGDFKFAFFQLCPPIDATAKKRYPDEGFVGTRIENFLNDELNSILELSSGIGPVFVERGGMQLGDKSLENRIYKLIRCGLVHDAEWPDDVELTSSMSFGHKNGTFIIPENYICMLPLVLIGAAENKEYSFDKSYFIKVGNMQIDINSYWGEIVSLKTEISAARGN